MENMRKKLGPLFNSGQSFRPDISVDSCTSYKVTAGGTLHLLSNSCGEYNINELGLQKRTSAGIDEYDTNEKTYQCASHEMCIFGVIGRGASSVVQKAIHIPTHRILALKKINTFEKEKRHQLLNEIRTLCEAPHVKGLVEFHGAFYTPASGQISIALEYMDGGSLRDLVQSKKCIPEPILSVITHEILHGLNFLHHVRHLVHRDIKPANLLINLNGEPKITDFGISVGLENTVAMCGTFVGTVTYMSPERIGNEYYSFPADIWSLGLSIFECGTGEFPYNASKGPVNLMLQVIYDPSPSPSRDCFSEEFCSFVDVCLQKDPTARPTAEQGCDASILLGSGGPISSELISEKNFGIRKLNAIDRIKSAVEAACPGTVSCADIIALAARDAVRLSGGPTIAIPLGRRDSMMANNVLADQFLPSAAISVDLMLNLFTAKGMTMEEAVAMLGAHTLGVGHCINVVNRLFPQKEENLGILYGNFLRVNCPTAVPLTNITFIPNDLTTLRFDNQYFKDIINGRGLFTIDSAISTDPRTAPTVSRFANDEKYFFQVFSSAFVKLSSTGVLTGNQGQIRSNCHFVN